MAQVAIRTFINAINEKEKESYEYISKSDTTTKMSYLW